MGEVEEVECDSKTLLKKKCKSKFEKKNLKNKVVCSFPKKQRQKKTSETRSTT